MPMLASAAPEILIAEIAAVTEHIRVGSGGVMLPHYSPLKVAETFSILGGLHGDRIDLGIGRAPGSDPRDDVRAAARPPPDVARRLPRAARRAARVLRGRLPPRPPVRAARGAARARPAGPTCGCSARRRRARSGPASSACPIRSPTSSTRAARRTPPLPRALPALASAVPQPEVAVCVSAICADTDEEAERLASSQRMAITLLRRGRLIAVPPVERALAFLEPSAAIRPPRRPARRSSARPTPSARGLEQVAHEYGAESDARDDHARPRGPRRRSYELIAEAFELGKALGVPDASGVGRRPGSPSADTIGEGR